MKKAILLFIGAVSAFAVQAQNVMNTDILWKLGRVSGVGISIDGQSVVYRVSVPSIEENKSVSKFYQIPVNGGEPVEIKDISKVIKDKNISPNGQYTIYDEAVKVNKVLGAEIYPEYSKTSAQIYESLDYRHWDTWNDGSYSHVFYKDSTKGAAGIDIMKNEPHHAPQKPFGGDEDYVWSPDGKSIVYVSKKKAGMDYALSTNTDLYEYNIATGNTVNLTDGMKGYDIQPSYSVNGDLAWLSIKNDGYESDKNDIFVKTKAGNMNITQHWDGTLNSYTWSKDGKKFYFTAATDGTIQLFEVDFPGLTKKLPVVVQLTKGDFDINGIVGEASGKVVVSRTDMNHTAELYVYDNASKNLTQLTHVNDAVYAKLKLPRVERRYLTTTDGKKMLTWVVLPPDFDATKKYPALLYCQGGPQSAVSQFYSYRWNFQLMASEGYIVIAPNRRGMPGFGVKWNEEISKDWGGQAMKDYMSAVDDVSKEVYVDTKRIAAVGASYGGYSVFQLAGTYPDRFKTFISHCGLFNTQSMYGTTEEIFFTNWDFGGPYWDKTNTVAQKAYTDFNPITHVGKWSKPILIIQGGKDYRVPENQAMEAFQAAQLRGIKSKFVYFPDENHWILKAQNAMVWQKEFYKWLKENL
jgi:dipeptidyl aminopeptidase/acylaminoacyl peptidase